MNFCQQPTNLRGAAILTDEICFVSSPVSQLHLKDIRRAIFYQELAILGRFTGISCIFSIIFSGGHSGSFGRKMNRYKCYTCMAELPGACSNPP